MVRVSPGPAGDTRGTKLKKDHNNNNDDDYDDDDEDADSSVFTPATSKAPFGQWRCRGKATDTTSAQLVSGNPASDGKNALSGVHAKEATHKHAAVASTRRAKAMPALSFGN
ncbi:unnamed protein product [Lampetra planeri]